MRILGIVLLVVSLAVGIRIAGAEDASSAGNIEKSQIEMEMSGTEMPHVKDSLVGFNRAMFAFNNGFIKYFARPLNTGYTSVVPPVARTGIKNFFYNIKMPVRFFNCLFQGKIKGVGTELARLVINSTVGVGGLWDPSTKLFHIKKQERDFGQTLGKGKVGSGAYIVWPFFGPSNVRDTAGGIVDAGLNPLSWVSFFFLAPLESVGTYAGNAVNDADGKIANYDTITKPAIDPYIALQDAYMKNREKRMKE
jgi:phospholipid-binding lipoprotein MlaA